MTERPYCDMCYEPESAAHRSKMFGELVDEVWCGELICEGCKSYEDYYLSLTPEERREEHRMADEYADEAVGHD